MTSPHSGQNFGAGPSGCQPHLSHFTAVEADLCEPHSIQNFPVFVEPQEHAHVPTGSGCFEPHSVQNFPVFVAPQEHAQPAACGAGF